MSNIELGSRDFESPESLTKKELQLLQQEILNSQITSLGEKITKNTDSKKKFIEERDTYLKRSKNEISKKRVSGLFNAILKKYGIDEALSSTVAKLSPNETDKSQASDNKESENTQPVTENTQPVTENTPNTINGEDANTKTLSSAIETELSSEFKQLEGELDNYIEEKINFLQSISTRDIYYSAFQSMEGVAGQILDTLQSKKEIIKQKVIEEGTSALEFDKLWGSFGKTIQTIVNAIPQILEIISEENSQGPIITKENYNSEETSNQILEYGLKLIESVQKEILKESPILDSLEIQKNDSQKGNISNTIFQKEILKIMYKGSLITYLLKKESIYGALQMAKKHSPLFKNGS